MLHGNERREWYGDGRSGRDWSTDLLGKHGPLDHWGTCDDELRPWSQPLHLAHDEIHGRDGALGFFHQRLHQARLERSLLLRTGGGGRSHSGNAADDRLGM